MTPSNSQNYHSSIQTHSLIYLVYFLMMTSLHFLNTIAFFKMTSSTFSQYHHHPCLILLECISSYFHSNQAILSILRTSSQLDF
jgi:hypothetical protein